MHIEHFNYLILQHLIIEILTMSTEEVEEDRRLLQCLRKYKTIIKQFDELELMDVKTRSPKRRKGTRGSNSSNDPAASANQPDNGQVFDQTITRYLHELQSNPQTDSNCSTSSRRGG